MKMPTGSSIEMLESRIAPAAIYTFFEPDGDLVTVSASKGTNTQLQTAVDVVAGNILSITLPNTIYEGSNLSITAKIPAGGHGDGRVPVPLISAAGTDLGIVSIDGDVGEATIGSSTAGVPAVKSFTALSIGLENGSVQAVDFKGAVPSLTIGGDVGEYGQIVVNGNLTTALVKGSMDGGAASGGGDFYVYGDAASITVHGAVVGGTAGSSGEIGITGGVTYTKVSVGSLFGGTATDTGCIVALGNLGAVTVTKDIVAGAGTVSGSIVTTQNITSVLVDGSIEGSVFGTYHEIAAGVNINTGVLTSSGNLGSVTVKGSAGESGTYFISAYSNIGSITVGGDMTDVAVGSGGTLGSVKVGGDLFNSDIFGHGTGTGSAIGSVSVGGNAHNVNIAAGTAVLTGQALDINAVLGSVTIAGEATDVTVAAGTVNGTASKISAVKIGGAAYNVGVTSDWIVSVSVDGLTAPLTAGSHNDNNVSFGDVLCNEV